MKMFGSQLPGVRYAARRAAYAVFITRGMRFAGVVPRMEAFLPGGGSLPGESPEETIVREVREELGCGARVGRKIGEAVQFFYSPANDRHYRMEAAFFVAELTDERLGDGEHEVRWLPVSEAGALLFHACHAWAVRQAFSRVMVSA